MEESTEIEYVDPREEIERLETRIEELSAEIEKSGKFILASRAAITLGGLFQLAELIGAISFNPTVMLAAIVAALGGIVVLGSSRSTANEAKDQLNAVELRRTTLISQIDLRVVIMRDDA